MEVNALNIFTTSSAFVSVPLQCCQLLAKPFGQINQKIRPPAKKFGPSYNILIEANIIGFSKIHIGK
jgi:hypothetical protein